MARACSQICLGFAEREQQMVCPSVGTERGVIVECTLLFTGDSERAVGVLDPANRIRRTVGEVLRPAGKLSPLAPAEKLVPGAWADLGGGRSVRLLVGSGGGRIEQRCGGRVRDEGLDVPLTVWLQRGPGGRAVLVLEDPETPGSGKVDEQGRLHQVGSRTPMKLDRPRACPP